MDIEAEIRDLKRRLAELESLAVGERRSNDNVNAISDDVRRFREDLPHIVAGAVRAALRYHA